MTKSEDIVKIWEKRARQFGGDISKTWGYGNEMREEYYCKESLKKPNIKKG